MSYSFTVRAATKAEALTLAGSLLDEAVAKEPDLAPHRAQAEAAAAMCVQPLQEAPGKEILLSLRGSVSELDANLVVSVAVTEAA